ncbi:MAG: sulfatase activating formylglycine-generating enzyme [Myxococcota bacterium]|jgi:formylglycine-generating enzyme required for sulfatase activity
MSQPDRPALTWTGPVGDQPSSGPLALPARYRFVGELGRGSMGIVYRVFDVELQRDVAMKVLFEQDDPRVQERFLQEARSTAQLEHPSIIPLYDIGELLDTRGYYTMRIAHGARLEPSLPLRGDPARPVALRRFVGQLREVAQALAYAHRHGVVHRDLKPENVAIDQRGRVQVVDWGLARVDTTVADPIRLGEPTGSIDGAVKGSPAYMAPEQAIGDSEAVGPPADVFALGAILYEGLAGRRLRTADNLFVLLALASQPISDDLWTLVDTGEATELVQLTRRMLDIDRNVRPSAAVVSLELSNWLDGVAAAARADRCVAQARAVAARADALAAQASDARRRARILSMSTPKNTPIAEKKPLWQLEDEADQLEKQVTLLEQERLIQLHRALTHVPSHQAARALLADHYLEAHRAAELVDDALEAARAGAQLRAFASRHHERYLRGQGCIRIALHRADADPTTVVTRLYRFEERDRRLEAVLHSECRGALVTQVPHGRWLAEITAPERATVRYPVWVPRDGEWDCVGPLGQVRPVRLPPASAVGPCDVVIPSSWAYIGGDPDTPSPPRPLVRVWVDSFVLRRDPVTNAEYLTWLNALVASGDEDRAAAHVPRSPPSQVGARAKPYYAWQDGRWALGIDGQGHRWEPTQPVVAIDWHDAMAYAAWLRDQTGTAWRLPAEVEWEKAARGADARALPWGNHADATWAWSRYSWSSDGAPRSVDEVPTDVSPYGVRGLAGNVSDWCLDPWTIEGPQPDTGVPDPRRDQQEGVSKGGSWSTGLLTQRAASRFVAQRDVCIPNRGFRLCHAQSSPDHWQAR